MRRRPFLAVLGLALALRLALFVVASRDDGRRLTRDSRDYAAIARDLSGSYTDAAAPAFPHGLKRGPVYPLFLAAAARVTTAPLRLVAALQVAFDLVSIGLVWWLSGRLLGPPAAIWAALALALDPITIIYSQYALTEAGFTLLLLVSTALVVSASAGQGLKIGRLAAAGFVLGTALLLRPIATYLPVVVAPAMWFFSTLPWRHRLAGAIAFVVAFATIPLGFRAWRNAVAQVPLVSTVEAENLLLYQAAKVHARVTGRSVEDTRRELRRELGIESGWGPDPIATTRAAKRRAISILFAHPVQTARSLFEGSLMILLGPGSAALAILLGRPDLPLAITLLLLAELMLFYAFVLVGIRRLARAGRWQILAPLGLALAWLTLAAAGYGAYSRFRTPMVPYLAMLAGAGVVGITSRRYDHPDAARLPHGGGAAHDVTIPSRPRGRRLHPHVRAHHHGPPAEMGSRSLAASGVPRRRRSPLPPDDSRALRRDPQAASRHDSQPGAGPRTPEVDGRNR